MNVTNSTMLKKNFAAAEELAEVLSQWILREKSLALTKNTLVDPTKFSLDKENRRRFPTSPAYDILFTVVNPDPEKLKIDWNLANVTDGGFYKITIFHSQQPKL